METGNHLAGPNFHFPLSRFRSKFNRKSAVENNAPDIAIEKAASPLCFAKEKSFAHWIYTADFCLTFVRHNRIYWLLGSAVSNGSNIIVSPGAVAAVCGVAVS